MNKRTVIEWAPFVLKEGLSEQDLLSASAALQADFLQHQSGFIRRELIKKSDREYVDVVHWNSRTDAALAIANAQNSPVCFLYFQLMAGADHANAGEGVSHFELVSEYE